MTSSNTTDPGSAVPTTRRSRSRRASRTNGGGRSRSRSAIAAIPPAFAPTRKQLLFIDEAVAQALRGKSYVQKDIAEASGVTKGMVSRWHRKPEFTRAVAQALREATPPIVEAMHLGQMRIAAQSLAHYQTQLRRLGLEAPGVGVPGGPDGQMPPGGPAAQLGGVHFHVHGVPERAPFATLPPPLELPAAPSSATPPAPAK